MLLQLNNGLKLFKVKGPFTSEKSKRINDETFQTLHWYPSTRMYNGSRIFLKFSFFLLAENGV